MVSMARPVSQRYVPFDFFYHVRSSTPAARRLSTELALLYSRFPPLRDARRKKQNVRVFNRCSSPELRSTGTLVLSLQPPGGGSGRWRLCQQRQASSGAINYWVRRETEVQSSPTQACIIAENLESPFSHIIFSSKPRALHS